MSKTLEQERAADALQKVKEVRQERKDLLIEYSSYAKSLPATILANGLGQAAATLLAKAKDNKKDAHYILYTHLREWLCSDREVVPYNKGEDLMEAITSNDRNAYIRAQAEALAWLQWLKKFAAAYLHNPEGEK
ncbi:CRISPR-associated protein, Cmr5 family [Desulfofarcimen acetoxidans DSM 771]|uniref:CRISPR type III-B/RAMP module-associated protein Cmr5 n=1 Tax=Desulfofarcimen acetoxidans (strain ATCC 49208 / DSM 771 / KCTC 5769 / VKM B-1644 / 5575) TaxID=485916 RepID=C8W2P6_DESAS|nr:type III-B CRISPR module-associated protein Cmr5 [Desulfofarcimen acetoxidans]ACV63730.1 CRISPR-associated protein, Cmr5 family [Desulfofarcimen acetoxidans DSM 771]